VSASAHGRGWWGVPLGQGFEGLGGDFGEHKLKASRGEVELKGRCTQRKGLASRSRSSSKRHVHGAERKGRGGWLRVKRAMEEQVVEAPLGLTGFVKDKAIVGNFDPEGRKGGWGMLVVSLTLSLEGEGG